MQAELGLTDTWASVHGHLCPWLVPDMCVCQQVLLQGLLQQASRTWFNRYPGICAWASVHYYDLCLPCVCVDRYGYKGFYNKKHKPVVLNSKAVEGIQLQGGTILGTSRGGADIKCVCCNASVSVSTRLLSRLLALSLLLLLCPHDVVCYTGKLLYTLHSSMLWSFALLTVLQQAASRWHVNI